MELVCEGGWNDVKININLLTTCLIPNVKCQVILNKFDLFYFIARTYDWRETEKDQWGKAQKVTKQE